MDKGTAVVLVVGCSLMLLVPWILLPFFVAPEPEAMSLDEAVTASGGSANPDDFVSFSVTGELYGDPFVHESGVTGYLFWLSPNNMVYQIDYPSSRILGEYLRIHGDIPIPEDGYYVWVLTLINGSVVWVEAQEGLILNYLPAR